MQTIIFSDHKKKIAQFETESILFEQDPGGITVSAKGAITFQDTPLLENYLHEPRACHVQVLKEGEPVLDDRFTVAFLVLEMNELVVRLS